MGICPGRYLVDYLPSHRYHYLLIESDHKGNHQQNPFYHRHLNQHNPKAGWLNYPIPLGSRLTRGLYDWYRYREMSNYQDTNHRQYHLLLLHW